MSLWKTVLLGAGHPSSVISQRRCLCYMCSRHNSCGQVHQAGTLTAVGSGARRGEPMSRVELGFQLCLFSVFFKNALRKEWLKQSLLLGMALGLLPQTTGLNLLHIGMEDARGLGIKIWGSWSSKERGFLCISPMYIPGIFPLQGAQPVLWVRWGAPPSLYPPSLWAQKHFIHIAPGQPELHVDCGLALALLFTPLVCCFRQHSTLEFLPMQFLKLRLFLQQMEEQSETRERLEGDVHCYCKPLGAVPGPANTSD